MTILWTNLAGTTLAAPITNSATSATLTSGGGALFPSPAAGQYFTLTLTDAANAAIFEITYCTARSGDTVTLTRGQEGTTALAFNAGDLAQTLLTAGSLQALPQLSTVNTWTGTNTFNAAVTIGDATTAHNPVALLQAENLFGQLAAANTWTAKNTYTTGVVSSGLDDGGAGGQFRATSTNYGVFLRNDNAQAYLLQTAVNDPNGTFNAYRPFSWSLSTGAVTIDGSGVGVTFGGSMTASANVIADGGFITPNNIGYYSKDTGGTLRQLLSYGADNNVYSRVGIGSTGSNGHWFIQNTGGSANVFDLDNSGNLRLPGAIFPTAGMLVGATSNPVGAATNGLQTLADGSTQIFNTTVTPFSIGVGFSTGSLIDFHNGSGVIGSVTTATGGSVDYNRTSDQTLKIDDGRIGIEQARKIIMGLMPRWYRWKAKPDAEAEPGFFAQQMSRVFRWGVMRGKGRFGQKGFRPWQIADGKLMPVVVTHLQDLERRLSALEAAARKQQAKP